ncbi:MAG TPA: phage tail sheath C-terminal domain-containing protein [Anaerolineales bacterium]|nr:phage tail sheath C-terminal domain-containing protein [Anaerolineales bacterium]
MAEMILPGVYIEVRPEGLIVPGRVTVGNVGMVGTSSKGPIGAAATLSSYSQARTVFGDYDPWVDGASDELTLVRALELAFSHGATTIRAVRVAGASKKAAAYTLNSATGPCVVLTAKSEGAWGNDLSVNVADATDNAYIENESVPTSGANALTLEHKPMPNARNRVRHTINATGITRSVQIVYAPTAAVAGQVQIDPGNGKLTFPASETPVAADTLKVSYVVDKAESVKVTLRLGRVDEVYTVVDGNDLIADVNASSDWVDATAGANAAELPAKSSPIDAFAAFIGGDNGAAGADYQTGLDALLNEDVHLVVLAGQDDTFGNELDAHCQVASTDAIKRDRIAVVGSRLNAKVDDIRGHTLDSDRVVFVAPGIKATDRAATPPVEVTLPGAYAAAAVAGRLASFSAHISLTNKTLSVGGLEQRFTSAELSQLVQSRVLALEERQGFRVVKGITTATNTAWHQITTRRIVDYAKFGVRSAATPYIGLLNNQRVRAALKTTINSFLAEMVDDEMLVSYELDVTATRDEERKGIARVTMVVRPTFSIDFIKVTMFLE